ncbi:MAG: hypothetical protein ACREF4_12670 [Gammaproteobacteria bacterium]
MRSTLIAVVTGLAVWSGVAWGAPAGAEKTPAPAQTVPQAEVQTLRERAAAFWAARMAGDDKGQWALLEPRGRGRLTPQEYAAGRRGIRYLGYQVEDAAIEGFFAVVKVRVLFQPILPRLASTAPQTVLMDDRWIRVGGAWYRQLDDRAPQRGEP